MQDQNFKAFMFDFDGTITEKGEFFPRPEMVDALVKVSEKMPIACCTGRQLDSFVRHGLNYLVEGMSPERKKQFLDNLFLICENGAIGYHFSHGHDEESHGDFRPFYEIDWPEQFTERQLLIRNLTEAVVEFGYPYEDAHRIVVVFRTKLHNDEHKDMNKVYQYSDQIYKIILDHMSVLDADFENFLHVGNSGLGVIVGPAEGDKDRGIRELAAYLERERSLGFDENAKEILVVGDSPYLGGNDHFFLKGEVGTPFNVGEDFGEIPSIHDEAGIRLMHSKATLKLIENLLA